MVKSMLNRKFTYLYLLFCLLVPIQALAQGQFYFLATTATEGATSSSGQGAKVVYLRWDVLEGKLPADVVSIMLYRDGELLLDKSINEVMGENEIADLYRYASQEQRLFETISRLKEVAIANGNDFNVSQYAAAIRASLTDDNSYYADMASKLDFNLAQSRYRAFIDRPAAGSYTYTLEAANAFAEKATLGKLTLDTRINRSVLPVSDFKQVRQSQCDVPERAKDDYTVSLDWAAPGVTNITDKLASSIFVSGYDLYRSSANLDAAVTVAPDKDIAQLAASSTHNERGEVEIAGLEKVNTLPLMLNAEKGGEFEWMETYDQLQKAGLKRGDRRAYYLVPIDFTGHYGATAKTIVTVPDLTRPATPWDVTFFADEANNEMHISWDKIDLNNFLNAYSTHYRFCNALTAEADGVLEYVARDEYCETAVHRKISLDVVGYKVYRFDSFQMASNFVDSDGDGIANLIERLPDANKPDDQKQYMQCDYSAQPGLGIDFLVAANKPVDQPLRLSQVTEELLVNTDRKRIVFRDTEPQSNKNDVYWYRIAAVTANDSFSLLTPPLRAIFPNRTLPDPPNITITHPGSVMNDCQVVAEKNPTAWSLTNNVRTSDEMTLHCDGNSYAVDSVNSLNVENAGLCLNKDMQIACANATSRSISLPRVSGSGFYCQADLPADLNLCSYGDQAIIEPVYGTGSVLVFEGSLVSGPLTITINAPANSCISLQQTVDTQDSRVATSCGTATPESLTYVTGSGFFCGYAVSHDENNNVSVPAMIPCPLARGSTPKPPSMPKVIGQKLLSNILRVSWKLPSEPLAATMIKVEHSKDGQPTGAARMFSVPVAGRSNADRINHDISISKTDGSTEKWCTSFQSVSPAHSGESSLTSGWTSPICTDKDAALPTYLPWPEVPRTSVGEPLVFNTVSQTGLIDPGVGNSLFVDLFTMTGDAACQYDAPPGQVFATVGCLNEGRFNINKELSSFTSFMVYRQSKNAGTLGDWIQVSPLIEYAHWDETVISDRPFFILNDPFIKLYQDTGAADQWTFVFKDNYPFINGLDYRYQIVFFGNNHDLKSVRKSDWISTQ
jgi:hypothetical protein